MAPQGTSFTCPKTKSHAERRTQNAWRLGVGLTCAFLIEVSFSQYVPPDYFGDGDQGAGCIRENHGQVLDTDVELRPDIHGYFEHSPIGIYLRDHSLVSFTLAHVLHDSTAADTLYRIDLDLSKNHDREPAFLNDAPGLSNYYIGDTAVEQVPANYRGIYRSVADSIDVHFYGSRGGPRMAYVVRPGGDPANILMSFTGQDSIAIDWLGALRLYVGGRWFKLEEAMPYQVDGNNLIPLAWTPSYVHEAGQVTVSFEFEDYDEDLPLVFQIGYPAWQLGGGDPTYNLNWSTFVGGSGGDELECVEVDEEGDPYICGSTYSYDFPVSTGTSVYPPYQPLPAGHVQAVVMKFSSEFKQIQWATYYRGNSSANDQPSTKAHKLDVYAGIDEELDYVFVIGSTNCTDLLAHVNPTSVFADAHAEDYDGGAYRAWVGAFTKESGLRHWYTTHGESTTANWAEHGLAIAVDMAIPFEPGDGRLAIGGMIETMTTGYNGVPAFPAVDPGSADVLGEGGAFFIVFDEDYQIEWASAWGTFDSKTRITDMRWDRNSWQTTGDRQLWFTGCDGSGSAGTPTLQQHAGGGYYSEEGNVIVARVNPTTYQFEYATLWPGSAAYGIHVTGTSVWVTGFSSATDYSATDMPEPDYGDGATLYRTDQYGSSIGQWSDGFILRFKRAPFDLVYGTLVGGTRDDVILDVNGRNSGEVFFTGETRSQFGFSVDEYPDRYYQSQYDYVNRRDAFILSMDDSDEPMVRWRTAFAGTQSDRGWGVAASESELYLVGTTASQRFDEFPLLEFDDDPQMILDYYQDWNLGGGSSMWVPWIYWSAALDHDLLWENPIEPLWLEHDGYIASFGIPPSTVSIEERLDAPQGIRVLTHNSGHDWTLLFDVRDTREITILDVLGRTVAVVRCASQRAEVQLPGMASGAYTVVARGSISGVHTTRFIKP